MLTSERLVRRAEDADGAVQNVARRVAVAPPAHVTQPPLAPPVVGVLPRDEVTTAVVLLQAAAAHHPEVAAGDEPAVLVANLVLADHGDLAHDVQDSQEALPGRLGCRIGEVEGLQEPGGAASTRRRGEDLSSGRARTQRRVEEDHQVEHAEVAGARRQRLGGRRHP